MKLADILHRGPHKHWTTIVGIFSGSLDLSWPIFQLLFNFEKERKKIKFTLIKVIEWPPKS
jgi:hypothetical protein